MLRDLLDWLRQFAARLGHRLGYRPGQWRWAATAGRTLVVVLRPLGAILIPLANFVQGLGQLVWAGLNKYLPIVIRAGRQNLLATALVLSGIALILVLLATPTTEPVAPLDIPQEQRPDYHVGAILSLTGKNERHGNAMRRGYDLALQAYNDSGGLVVNGVAHNLALIIYDDESSPTRAGEVVRLLLDNDKPEVLLGPYSSALARPVLKLASSRQVPMVAAVASPAGFADDSDHKFLLQTPPQLQLLHAAIAYAGHARQRLQENPSKPGFAGGKQPRIVLAGAPDPHAQAVIAGVEQYFAKAGIGAIEHFDLFADDEQFSEAAAELREVDAMFVSAYAQGTTRLLEHIVNEGLNLPVLALTHCDVASIRKREPTAAEGALCALHWQPGLGFAGSQPLAQGFSDLYYDRHGSQPGHQAAAAAAAVQVVVNALRAAQRQSITIMQALQRTNIDTFYGPVKFDAQGRNIVKPMVINQIVQSRYVPVAPADIATRPIVFERPQLEDDG